MLVITNEERNVMHFHTLTLVQPSGKVFCGDCDIELRLATFDEAQFVHDTGTLDAENGPLILENSVVVVPRGFSLFRGA